MLKQLLNDLSRVNSKEQINNARGQVNKSNSLENTVEYVLSKYSTKIEISEIIKKATRDNTLFVEGLPLGCHYISQPLGSQSFPDFSVFMEYENKHIGLYVECKSSKSRIPVWNCTYPKRRYNVIYIIHTSKNTVVLNGNDAISEEQYNHLKDFDKEIYKWKEIVEQYNKKMTGWSYYPRNMYNQTLPFDKHYDIITPFQYAFPNEELKVSLEEKEDMSEYHDNYTSKYITSQERSYRSTRGQFFTPKRITQMCVERLVKHGVISPLQILEPSAGTGEFLNTIQKQYPESSITAVELDTALYHHISTEYPLVNCINEDFLKTFCQYDLIVGNPPYFELSGEDYKRRFGSVVQGRSNIYALFVYHAIQLLSPQGTLCLVIPESLKSSPSFSNLRSVIAKKCSILEMFSTGNFSSDVSQSCMVFICRKGIPDGIFIHPKSGIFLSSDEYTLHETIADTGVSIKTGQIVWNVNKDKLTNDTHSTLLIYSDNISKENTLKLRSHQTKLQYINLKGKTTPALIVSRSSGKTIKCLLLDGSREYLCENHVNEITGDYDTLEKIYSSLNDQRTIDYLNDVVGTVNLSKTQLLCVPIFPRPIIVFQE